MEKLTNEQKVAKATIFSDRIESEKNMISVIESALEMKMPITDVRPREGFRLNARKIGIGPEDNDYEMLGLIQRSYLRQLKDLYSARLDRFQKEFDALWKN